MKDYTVSVSCNFLASDPIDAVKQMVAWLDDNACAARYRVDDARFPGSLDVPVDAAIIDFNAVTDDGPENYRCRMCGRNDVPLLADSRCADCLRCPETGYRGTRCVKPYGHYDDCEFAPSPNHNPNPGGTNP